MGGDLLCADALVKGPEADGGVVAGRNGFAPVFADSEGGDGGWVGKHVVSTLTWRVVRKSLRACLANITLTRVGIVEPDELVLMPANNDAFDTASIAGPGRTVNNTFFI